MFKRIALLAMVAMLFFAAQAARANAALVTNGNFSAGSTGLSASDWQVTGWTISGDPGAWATVNTDGNFYTPAPLSATYAQFSTYGQSVSISQALTTASNQAYAISFYLQNTTPASTSSNQFQALWNGTQVVDMLGGQTTGMSSEWTEYSFTVIGTGSDTLAFNFLQDAGMLSVTDVTAAPVPVPAALLLFGPGLAAIAVVRKRVAV
jgi:hypothetical protein